MCPDSTLLMAAVDGTLLPADARAVGRHVAACGTCAQTLARFQQTRDAEHAPRGGQQRAERSVVRALAVGATLLALGVWLALPAAGYVKGGVLPRSDGSASVSSTGPRQLRSIASRPIDLRRAMAAVPTAPVVGRVLASVPREPLSSPRPDRTVDDTRAAVHARVDAAEQPAASAHGPVGEPAVVDAAPIGLVVRGVRGKAMWRVRQGLIEHSVDGGATWADEYRAARAIAAGAYVAPDVVWLAGADGLILRRTADGWFEAGARADGDVASIRASSPTKASITLTDGRAFDTRNAGVTWTEASPASQKGGVQSARSTRTAKHASASRRRPVRSRRS